MNKLDIRTVTLTKGLSVGVTCMTENMVAYYMSDLPQEISYIFSDDDMMEKWTKKLEPLLMDIIND